MNTEAFAQNTTEQAATTPPLAAGYDAFRALIHAAPWGVYVVNHDFRIAEVNPVAKRVFGDIEGLVGRDFGEVIHTLWSEEYANEVAARFRHTLDTGESYSTPERIEERRDRRVVEFYEWQISRVQLPDGHCGVVCYFRDVSSRVRAEQAILDSRADVDRQRRIYDAILSNTPDLAYVFDLNHRFTYANAVLLRMWGRTWDEAIGKNCLELGYEPWHAAMHDREIEQVIATKKPIRGEVPFTGTFGRRIYDYIFVPVLNSRGEVEAIAGTTRDVTERKQSEEALRASELRLNLALDGGQMGLWEWDLQSGLSVWNAKEYELLGFPRGEGHEPAQKFLQLVITDDLARLQASLNSVMSDGLDWREEFRIKRPDGTMRWLAAVARVYRDDDGKPLKMIGVNYDVTDGKRAEMRNRFLIALDDSLRPLSDPQQIVFAAARVLGEHLQVDRCAYADVEEDADTMNLVGNYTSCPDVISIVGRLKFSDFGAEVLRLMRENKPFVVENVDTHQPPVSDPASYRATQIQAVICVPLHKAGRFVAAMAVHMRTPRAWTVDDVELVSAVAARCWESIERARLERGLRETEQRARRMADNSPVLIWQTDATGIVYVNKHCLDFFAASMDDVRGFGWTKFLHAEDRDAYLAAYTSAFAKQEAYEHQCRFCNGDGEFRWLHSRGEPHFGEDGRFLGFVGSSADVTEIKRGEEKLRASEERFRAFVTTSSNAVFIMSPDWTELRHMTGRNLVEDTPGPIRDWMTKYIHPDDHSRAHAVIAEAIQKKHAVEMEHRVIRPDGSVGWTHSRAIPLLDANGDIVEWFGAATDITKRRDAEHALRKSEERYRSLFESIDEGFCVIEMIFDDGQHPVDYRFIEVNPAFERQTGVHGATGKRMLEFVSHIEPHWLENYGRVAVTGEPIRFADEYKSLHSWFDVYAFRVGDPGSRRVAVIFNNITKRIEAERAVHRSRTELAAANEQLASRARQLDSLVEKRTAELRETVQQLETFSYSIVHDMRAPLRSMRSFAGILRDDYSDRLDAVATNYLRRIIDSASRMDSLITDVLNYSRVSMSETELMPVDLDKLVPDLLEHYPQFQEKAAFIHVARPLPRVRGNAALLTQVFSNLLGNALKFVPAGRDPSVHVRAEHFGGRVRIIVEDNGIGIPAELQGKIFGLFQRLHRPDEYSGTGVGLAIVKRAVEKMEGELGLESEPGRGSIFWISLNPVAK